MWGRQCGGVLRYVLFIRRRVDGHRKRCGNTRVRSRKIIPNDSSGTGTYRLWIVCIRVTSTAGVTGRVNGGWIIEGKYRVGTFGDGGKSWRIER